MMKSFSRLVLVVSISMMSAHAIDAQVLYSDSFSRTTGSGDANGNPAGTGNGASDWGTADNMLGGTESIVWTAGRNGSPTGGAQFVTNGDNGYLYSGAVHTDTSIAGLAADGFTVSFDFDRFDDSIAGASTNGLISVGTGYDETVDEFSPFEVTGNASFAVLFQQAANGNVGNMNVFAAGNSIGTFDYGDPEAEHSVLIAFTPDVSGAYGAADNIGFSVSVDGAELTSGSVAGGAEFGDLAFATNLFTASYIDNLVVSATAVPEPGSMALIGICFAGLATIRRRVS